VPPDEHVITSPPSGNGVLRKKLIHSRLANTKTTASAAMKTWMNRWDRDWRSRNSSTCFSNLDSYSSSAPSISYGTSAGQILRVSGPVVGSRTTWVAGRFPIRSGSRSYLNGLFIERSTYTVSTSYHLIIYECLEWCFSFGFHVVARKSNIDDAPATNNGLEDTTLAYSEVAN